MDGGAGADDTAALVEAGAVATPHLPVTAAETSPTSNNARDGASDSARDSQSIVFAENAAVDDTSTAPDSQSMSPSPSPPIDARTHASSPPSKKSDKRAIARTNAFVELPKQAPMRVPVATLHFDSMPRVNHELRPAVLTPGTHPLRNLLSGEWNFPPYYQHIAPPEAINFAAIPSFTTSSRDSTLRHVASQIPDVEFCASSSSTTGVLSQIYYAFSHFRPIDTAYFSLPFQSAPRNYTRAARKPESIYVRRRDVTVGMPEGDTLPPATNSTADVVPDTCVGDDACVAFDHRAPAKEEWDNLIFNGASAPVAKMASESGVGKDGGSANKAASKSARAREMSRRVVWGLDAAKVEGEANNVILMDLGKSMERMVTMRPEAFAQSLLVNQTAHSTPDSVPVEDVSASLLTPQSPEAFSFSRVGRTLVRSQLDSHDPLLLKQINEQQARSEHEQQQRARKRGATTATSGSLLDGVVTEVPAEPYTLVAPAVNSSLTATCADASSTFDTATNAASTDIPITPATTAIFDLKTRAANPIRNNVARYFENLNYRITRMRGLFQSFEREWYDMARSGFMKYAFQLRIGYVQRDVSE